MSVPLSASTTTSKSVLRPFVSELASSSTSSLSSQCLATLQYKQREYRLMKECTVIGSGTVADIRLNEPQVAKKHAEIHLIPPKATGQPTQQSAVLKVLADKGHLRVFVNKILVPNKAMLKSNDCITLGNKHSFVFVVKPVKEGNSSAASVTPFAKMHPKWQKRNLVSDFEVQKSMSQRQAKPLLAPFRTLPVVAKQPSMSYLQTPSSVRIQKMLKETLARQAVSPSVRRYFRRLNGKCSTILQCIEKNFPGTPRSPLDDEKVPLLVTDSLSPDNSPQFKTTEAVVSLVRTPLPNTPSQRPSPLTRLSKWRLSGHFLDVSVAVAKSLACKATEPQPPSSPKDDSPAKNIMSKLLETAKGLRSSMHSCKVSRLLQPGTPPADYDQPHLAQLRALFQSAIPKANYDDHTDLRPLFRTSPVCCYEPEYMLAIRRLYQNVTPPARYDGGHLGRLRRLLQANTPPANFDRSCLRQIRCLGRGSPQGDYGNDHLEGVSTLFETDNSSLHGDTDKAKGRFLVPRQSPAADYSAHLAGIRRLQQITISASSPGVNFAEKVQFLRHLYRPASKCSSPSPRINFQSSFRARSPEADNRRPLEGMNIFQSREEEGSESFTSSVTSLFSFQATALTESSLSKKYCLSPSPISVSPISSSTCSPVNPAPSCFSRHLQGNAVQSREVTPTKSCFEDGSHTFSCFSLQVTALTSSKTSSLGMIPASALFSLSSLPVKSPPSVPTRRVLRARKTQKCNEETLKSIAKKAPPKRQRKNAKVVPKMTKVSKKIKEAKVKEAKGKKQRKTEKVTAKTSIAKVKASYRMAKVTRARKVASTPSLSSPTTSESP